jgi:lactate dehydrogenase-like 2-hydroxyacid dehydrogenase
MTEAALVTEEEYGKAGAVFHGAENFVALPAPAREEALASAVLKERACAVIIGIAPYVGPLYQALREVAGQRRALIARFGVGHENVDKALARQHGIIVCNTPGALDRSVAEHAFWLIGALARRIPRLETKFRAGEFAGETGMELHGRCLGILGFGRIGRLVASMARFGLGMRVMAAGTRTAEQLEEREGLPMDAIRERWGVDLYTSDAGHLLREADVLSIHLPASPATRHFLNASNLASLKPTALLVNTARGSVLDEAALYDALVAGRLAGAALDVFENEPYRPVAPDKDLRLLPNVVLTPHIGSNTQAANRRMAEACLANVTFFFSGQWDRISVVSGTL